MKGEVRLCDLLATYNLFKVPQPNSNDKSEYPKTTCKSGLISNVRQC
jgi:hypothetical protein